MPKKIHRLKRGEEITIHLSRHVMIKGLTEEYPVQIKIEDGKYVIMQSSNEEDEWEPKSVFAFEIRHGIFSIVSITGHRDFATLAAQVWHLSFTDKQKTALRKAEELQKELSKIKKDLKIRISRDSRYRKRLNQRDK